LKWTLPRPPRPPLATTAVAASVSRSAIKLPSPSSATVPTGTFRRTSAPLRPVLRPPAPSAPSTACHLLRRLYSARSLRSWVASRITEPPRPPSPPSGPPRGTKGSRRKEAEPRPPWPPRTVMRAEPTNRVSDLVGQCALRVPGDSRLDGGAPAIFAHTLV